jgi:uncharacterized protein (TIGR02246 family)
MRTLRYLGRIAREVCTMAGVFVSVTACTPKGGSMNTADLTDFATRYAAAWSSQNPDKFATFYDENGSLIVNGASSVGRAAITATARAYMSAFPDMVVKLDSLRQENDQTIFHWTWTGTNTGPGGTGKAVHLSGYERWTMGATGLIAKSDGHFDNDEYQRQLKGS